MQSLVPLTDGSWDKGYAIGLYNNYDGSRSFLGECIYRYLYRKQWFIVDSLARLYVVAIRNNNDLMDVDLLVPVPSSRALSDYDPTNLLVDWISQLTTIPRVVGILARYGLISKYSDGSTLDATRGGITVAAPEAVRGKRVLLIDGLICSGVTLSSAVSALKAAGALEVKVLVYTKIPQGFGTPGLRSNSWREYSSSEPSSSASLWDRRSRPAVLAARSS